MITEIPHDHWPEFLGRFGHDHLGWRVTLESQRPGRGKLIEVENSSLQDMLADQAGDHAQISIVVGGPAQRSQTHVVDDPTRLVLSDDQPSERDLEIDARDGTVTLVSVRAPLQPM